MGPTEFIAALRKGKPAAAYFLRGPDRFLHEECRRAIVVSLPPEVREWCLAEIEFQPGRLERELEGAGQMPMLGGRSFFLFSDPEDFKHASDEDYEALEGYLERPSPWATVVFAAVEPDRRRRFIQLLEKKAVLVEIEPLTGAGAATWLKDYLQQAGCEIEPNLAEEIVAKFETVKESPGETQRAGVNLLWLRTEIDKLLTARPGAKRLERADLELMVAFREEHEISKLLEAIAERRFARALERLRSLLSSKEPETLLLWCIGDLFRQALKSVSVAPYGRGPQRAGAGGWNRFGGPFATQRIAPQVLRNYSREETLQALRSVRRADLGIKSSWKDSKILLEFLIWQLTVGKGSESLPAFFEPLTAPSIER